MRIVENNNFQLADHERNSYILFLEDQVKRLKLSLYLALGSLILLAGFYSLMTQVTCN